MGIGPGDSLGPYRILEQLGQGGMATVYRAHHEALDRDVAIKVMRDFLTQQEGFADRFRREARAVARLRHPNIVPVFDYSDASGIACMVSDYIDGGTLARRMGATMSVDQTVELLTPIAQALDYAHGRGVLHRDVKPANVLLDAAGTPYLSDFGLAKLLGDKAQSLTTEGLVVGTPEYMSPEQGLGQALTAAADVYSLAIVAYQMVTGRVPFTASSPVALLVAQVNEPPPPPRTLNPALSREAESAILRGLAKEPADRPATCGEFVRALAPLTPPAPTRASPRQTAILAPEPVAAVVAARPPERWATDLLLVGIGLAAIGPLAYALGFVIPALGDLLDVHDPRWAKVVFGLVAGPGLVLVAAQAIAIYGLRGGRTYGRRLAILSAYAWSVTLIWTVLGIPLLRQLGVHNRVGVRVLLAPLYALVPLGYLYLLGAGIVWAESGSATFIEGKGQYCTSLNLCLGPASGLWNVGEPPSGSSPIELTVNVRFGGPGMLRSIAATELVSSWQQLHGQIDYGKPGEAYEGFGSSGPPSDYAVSTCSPTALTVGGVDGTLGCYRYPYSSHLFDFGPDLYVWFADGQHSAYLETDGVADPASSQLQQWFETVLGTVTWPPESPAAG